MLHILQPLVAVHIADGYLNRPLDGLPWLIGGYVVAALFALWGSWRIRDEEIPRIALLSAAFTVASALHVSAGPASVHLILNGLVGAVLGRRAALAIPVGLFLQAVAGHGGFSTLGVNSCVMLTPALLAGFVVRNPAIRDCCRLPAMRTVQIAVSALIWSLGAVIGVGLLVSHAWQFTTRQAVVDWSLSWLPLALAVGAAVAVIAVILERRLRPSPEFAQGFLVGQFAVLMSVGLSALVMLIGGPANEGAYLAALIFFIAHLPLAVVEGFVVGFMLAYLARVKPELLQEAQHVPAVVADEPALAPAIVAQSGGLEECAADTVS